MKTHGLMYVNGKRRPEYMAWCSMRQRCYDKKNEQYKNYGGRGIAVCHRWMKFENFFADMGERPSPKHSLDRYPNNDGNYEPGNVRWATTLEQSLNKRTSTKYNGKNVTVIERELGLSSGSVNVRLRQGWGIEKATTLRKTISNPINKELLISLYKSGKRVKEISKIMNTKYGTISSQIHNLRTQGKI